MEKVDLLFYICVRVLMWEDFSQVRVADSLLVFHYLPVCEIEDESVYNGNFIQYKYNFISIKLFSKSGKDYIFHG